ncbi:IclR family transcriptional regulator C-terminal domain-containing protein [Nesterenkonia pannonica]|uniref:IclR family transcriptional regulator n=1 Tax=Nesterenkonia pannonica TaxID=1548602 RepID=UPI002164DFEA|nr:IclR family transcriptional regulator C-terminal domain-containing protein [Nesterenkonia pannonica]
MTITQTEGKRMIGVAQQYVGQRGPLHATSTGKVLLAHADPAEQRRAIGSPMTAFTASTLVEPQALEAELEKVLQRGWASAVAEWEEGINAVAVPIKDAMGGVVAALSVTALPSVCRSRGSTSALRFCARQRPLFLGRKNILCGVCLLGCTGISS